MSARNLVSSIDAVDSALARLRAALAQPKTGWTRDAAIQRFEFTFEEIYSRLAQHAAALDDLAAKLRLAAGGDQ